MTRYLTGDWTRDLPHSRPALYHYAIEEAVVLLVEYMNLNSIISLVLQYILIDYLPKARFITFPKLVS